MEVELTSGSEMSTSFPSPSFAELQAMLRHLAKEEPHGSSAPPSIYGPHGPQDELLYHYTSIEKFKNILHSSSLWTTDTRALNDHQEEKIIHDLVKNFVIFHISGNMVYDHPRYSGRYARLRPVLHGVSDDFHARKKHVFCLSDEDDLLSQWEGYAPEGISIGFCKKCLSLCASEHSAFLLRCDYHDLNYQRIGGKMHGNPADHDEYTRRYRVNEYFLELIRRSQVGSDADACHLVASLSLLGPMSKHHGFREEKEWRFLDIDGVSTSRKFQDSAGRCRSEIKFGDLDLHCDQPIRTITLSPRQAARDVDPQAALKDCWVKYPYQLPAIALSTIPLRPL